MLVAPTQDLKKRNDAVPEDCEMAVEEMEERGEEELNMVERGPRQRKALPRKAAAK